MTIEIKRDPISLISRRLIVYLVLCSSVITLIISAFQLYRGYQSDISIIEAQFEEIEKVHLKGITENLWLFNTEELKTLVEGMSLLGDVSYISVRDKNKFLLSAGEIPETNSMSHNYPLIYDSRGTDMEIGQMVVVVSLRNTYQKLLDRTMVIVIGNAIKTALVVTFMILIYHFVVIRHLIWITNYLSDIDLGVSHTSLTLNRRNNSAAQNDELNQMVNSINEMSERTVRAFSMVQIAEQRTRNFAESSSDWFWEMDADLRFTYLSKQFEDTTKLKITDMIGTRRWERPSQQGKPELWANHKADMEAARPFKNFEYSTVLENGKIVQFSISGVPVFDSNGIFTGYHGSTTDITHRKSLEEQVRRSQKMKAVGQLTGGIAHDFNNILAIVLGNLEILEFELLSDEKALDRIEKAKKGALRGAEIARKLLGFSSTDTRDVSVISVNSFIEDLEDLIAKSLTASIKVETELAGNLWRVEINSGDLQDVILNLSLNARDAMPEGGTLYIETENKTLDDEYFHRNPEGEPGEYVMISVSDTGEGMSREVQEKVFEPFFTTKEQGNGTGLGLSMVYGFIQRSNGHVKIYSEIGKGTNFRLYLPRAIKPVQDQIDTKFDIVDLPMGNEKILVVDDESDLLEIAVFYLNELGYETITAENGKKALEILRHANNVDLLFSDVVMPGGLDGFQLASAAHELSPNLKVLCTSGFTKRQADLDCSADKYLIKLNNSLLSKPYNKTELAYAIQRTLNENI
ncbi:MAG: response regulator [Sneathiella sp.]|nr:response regulator [Sneathiella sp.]